MKSLLKTLMLIAAAATSFSASAIPVSYSISGAGGSASFPSSDGVDLIASSVTANANTIFSFNPIIIATFFADDSISTMQLNEVVTINGIARAVQLSLSEVSDFNGPDLFQFNQITPVSFGTFEFTYLPFSINIPYSANPVTITTSITSATITQVTPPPSNVPEPTSIALLGLGLLGFAASRRK